MPDTPTRADQPTPVTELRARLQAAGIPIPDITDAQRADVDRRLQEARDDAARIYGERRSA